VRQFRVTLKKKFKMKNLLLAFILLLSIKSIGQQKNVEIYKYNDDEIKYSRIDYSQYGISQIFITMYVENEKNKLIENTATSFLKEQSNLYHTLYFFIEIPNKYKFEEKEIIFKEILNDIEKKEDLKNFNVFLNFDIDYSSKYQNETLEAKSINKIKRINIDITNSNIKNSLFIR
jgi:hypothetical protein